MSLLLALTASGGGGGAYTLTALGGAYTLTGQSASLYRSRVLVAQAGTYIINGQAITITKSGMSWPLESDVRLGVQYGPTGTEYAGTMTGGGGSTL